MHPHPQHHDMPHGLAFYAEMRKMQGIGLPRDVLRLFNAFGAVGMGLDALRANPGLEQRSMDDSHFMGDLLNQAQHSIETGQPFPYALEQPTPGHHKPQAHDAHRLHGGGHHSAVGAPHSGHTAPPATRARPAQKTPIPGMQMAPSPYGEWV